jgi:hypothetical protein
MTHVSFIHLWNWCELKLDSFGPVTGFCKHGNEQPSGPEQTPPNRYHSASLHGVTVMFNIITVSLLKPSGYCTLLEATSATPVENSTGILSSIVLISLALSRVLPRCYRILRPDDV